MSVAAIPIGVDLVSPVTWFLVAVGAIILALTLSTRRSNMRPRAFTTAPAAASAAAGSRAPDAADWLAAQSLFIENPRAGGERARGLVERAAREHGWQSDALDRLESYRTAAAISARADPTTDELREAFVGFRRAFDAIAAGERAPAADR